MARITVEDCVDKFPSRFELVLVASQRARKLFSGENPTVEKDNDKNTVIALREIADSTISVEEMKEGLIEEYQTITINDEEIESLELESSKNDQESEDGDTSAIELNTHQEVDKEIKELSSTEESELKEQYQISEDLEDSEKEKSSDNLDQKDEF
tara:strand:+ start:1427 stop:1891 length:465 start_codon:yes stop_codon:yes gene_type:complete